MKDFHGSIIEVYIAESKTKDSSDPYNLQYNPANSSTVADLGGQDEINGDGGKDRGQGDASAKAWQQDGDWLCPNTRSVM